MRNDSSARHGSFIELSSQLQRGMHEDPIEGSPCKDEDDSSMIRIDGDDISSPDILQQK